jgi:hypothetical protein
MSILITNTNILRDLANSLTLEERKLIAAHIKGDRTSQSWRLIRRLRFQLKRQARRRPATKAKWLV